MIRNRAGVIAIYMILGLIGQPALAEPKHGIAMYGEPALPQDFVHLPQANPDAPKGGHMKWAELGGFDSLNPYLLKGRAPEALRHLAYESLMVRSYDEPFTLYGLLAETVDTDDARSWVEFTLRNEAKFADGSPVTVEDVIWSFETLGTKGHPRYKGSFDSIEKIEKTGDRSVKFYLKGDNRELPLILGLRPILNKKDFENRAFDEPSLDLPNGSGPYQVEAFEANRYVTLKRNPDYWAKDLPVMQGINNIDEIKIDYYGDADAMFEAFKAGEVSWFRDGDAQRWATQYNFAAVETGDIVKSEIKHQRPSGMNGFVFNTRRELFKDWRVREALILAFNFDFMNKTLNNGTETPIKSYFGNSPLGMADGPAEGRVKEILTPFAADLLPGALEGYAFEAGDADGRNRGNIRKAKALLLEAGYEPKDGKLTSPDGKPFSFEILISNRTLGAVSLESIANLYSRALDQLGVDVEIKLVDDSQYQERITNYDYDMTYYAWYLSLSPGTEQKLYWGSTGVTEPGSRNYMGADNPAIDPLIDGILNARTQDDFLDTVRALDRVLVSGRYVVPFWFSPVGRIAHTKDLKHPEYIQLYGDWSGFMPEVWWIEN